VNQGMTSHLCQQKASATIQSLTLALEMESDA
jgi:hypothetical protein